MQRQQSGVTRAGCWPSGQASQRTVEQSTFLALDPLVSVVGPVVVPEAAVPDEPVDGTVAAVVFAAVAVPWGLCSPTSPPVIVPPWCIAQPQSARTARSPVNRPNLFVDLIASSFRPITPARRQALPEACRP